MIRVSSLTFTFELRARQFEEVELLDAFFFLLESSHVYLINMCEVKSFLYNQSV